MAKPVHVIVTLMLLIYAVSASASGSIVLASQIGARLDSDLMIGGGTDDTAVLQRVLNKATGKRPLDLVIDGPALVSGLEIRGYTTVECIKGAGFYLKDHSNRAVIRNAHRTPDVIEDEHIVLKGCFLNGNREHNYGYDAATRAKRPCSTDDGHGDNIDGIQFYGVNDLSIRDTTVWSMRAYGIHVANVNYVDLRQITVDSGVPYRDIDMFDKSCDDAVHVEGPTRYIFIDGLRARTGDDGISLDEEETGIDPLIKPGPIIDVVATNIDVMDSESALRIVSDKERVDGIVVSNIAGTVSGLWGIGISHFLNKECATSHENCGDIGSIIIGNVNLAPSQYRQRLVEQLIEYGRNLQDGDLDAEFNSGNFPFININGHAENISLRNVTTRSIDSRPVLRVGPDSDVGTLTVDLTIYDPGQVAVPIQLDKGSHVGKFNLSLDWSGAPDKAIDNKGGFVDKMHWEGHEGR